MDLKGTAPIHTLPWVLLTAYLFLPSFPEQAVCNMWVKECGYPEASGLLLTSSLASISQEVLGPSKDSSFAYEKGNAVLPKPERRTIAFLTTRLETSGLEHQTGQGPCRQSPQELLALLLARRRFLLSQALEMVFLYPSFLFWVTNYCSKPKSLHPEGLKMISQDLLFTASELGGVSLWLLAESNSIQMKTGLKPRALCLSGRCCDLPCGALCLKLFTAWPDSASREQCHLRTGVEAVSGSLALAVSPLLINPHVRVDTQRFIRIADLLLRALLQQGVHRGGG